MCCGGSSPPAPAAPDYASIIPLQERSNLNQFNAMLNAQRTNSITPFGRQTWYRPGEQVPNAFPQTSSVDPRSVGGRSTPPMSGGGAPPPSCMNPGDGRGNRGAPGPSIGQPGGFGGSGAMAIGTPPGGPSTCASNSGPEGALDPNYNSLPRRVDGGMVSDMQYRGGPISRGPGSKFGGEPPSAVSYGGGGPPQEMQTRAAGGGVVPGTEGMQDMGDYSTWTPQDRTRGVPTPGSQPGGAPGGQQPSYQDAAQQGPWTMVQELDPREQWLRDQDLRIRAGQGDISEGMMGNVAEAYRNPANFAGQFRQFGDDYFAGSGRNRAEDAIYNRQMRFMEPKMQQAESRLHQRLASQGFDTRGDAYNEQMQNLGEQQNTLRADAADRAILGGSQEASSELARSLQRAGFQQNQSLQGINLQERDRGRLLNELNSFRTGQQVQLPNVSPTTQTPSLAGIDHLGLAQQNYSNQLGAWNAGQAGQDNMMSGLFGLAGSAMGGPLGGWLASQLPRR